MFVAEECVGTLVLVVVERLVLVGGGAVGVGNGTVLTRSRLRPLKLGEKNNASQWAVKAKSVSAWEIHSVSAILSLLAERKRRQSLFVFCQDRVMASIKAGIRPGEVVCVQFAIKISLMARRRAASGSGTRLLLVGFKKMSLKSKVSPASR